MKTRILEEIDGNDESRFFVQIKSFGTFFLWTSLQRSRYLGPWCSHPNAFDTLEEAEEALEKFCLSNKKTYKIHKR